jgi:Protein of unknown function (DUF1266)/Right handed beta helix region
MSKVAGAERATNAHHELNQAHRWVLAAMGVLLRHHQMTFDLIGGLSRPAWSGRMADRLLRDFGILTAADAREVIDQLTAVDIDPALVSFDRMRALGVAAWAFGAWLFELEEAWPLMLGIARELQRSHSSWAALGESYLAGQLKLAGESPELERMKLSTSLLLTEDDSAWNRLSWDLPLGPASALPRLVQTVRTVDQSGSADFTSIAAALEAAVWGDLIRLMPGVYRERLWIETPVEIEGVGDVLIDSDLGCCLMIKSSAAVVRRVRLRSGTDPSGEAMHAAIVRRGFLKLVDCDITSARLGVYLAGAQAFVSLKDTLIHDAANAGILVTDGVLVMDGGGIRGSKVVNLQVEGSTEARLERVTLGEAGQAGLAVRNGAEVDVLDSVIKNNLFGVDASAAGRVNLIGCRVENNSSGGARAFGRNSRLHIEGSRLSRNGAVNVGADEGAAVEVIASEVEGGACAGWADHRGTIRFEACRIRLGEEGLVREMNGGKIELVDSKADVQPMA